LRPAGRSGVPQRSDNLFAKGATGGREVDTQALGLSLNGEVNPQEQAVAADISDLDSLPGHAEQQFARVAAEGPLAVEDHHAPVRQGDVPLARARGRYERPAGRDPDDGGGEKLSLDGD
jgi:hypothetical protein